jgi:hypothetical protein
MDQLSAEQKWLPVIGRSLAQLCLQKAGMEQKSIRDKAVFLSALGIEIDDCAKMLNSTAASIRELLRTAKASAFKSVRGKRAVAKKI